MERAKQEIIQRQLFYAELNDVQAERMFLENVMKLGKEIVFCLRSRCEISRCSPRTIEDYGYHMYKLYKDVKQDDLHLVGIRLKDIAIWQFRNRQRQTKLTYDWDQIDRIAFDKKSFSIVLKRQANETKIKYLTNNSKKYGVELVRHCTLNVTCLTFCLEENIYSSSPMTCTNTPKLYSCDTIADTVC